MAVVEVHGEVHGLMNDLDEDRNADPTCPYVEQFVLDVMDLSSQYGSDTSMSYTALNMTGGPTIYPSYGDYPEAFALKTYGIWWDNSTLNSGLHQRCSSNDQFSSQDFIDLKFERKVYPHQLLVYETYNPGAIIRILAYNNLERRWATLWQGNPTQAQFNVSRIFYPLLSSCCFMTDILRLEFYHRHMDYYVQLDAIMLSGYTSLPFSSALLHKRLWHLSLESAPTNKALQEDNGNTNWFDLLPSEVIHLILSHLDLISLCRASCVSRSFHKHCSDPLLYCEVNLQPCCEKISNEAILGLQSRCTNIRKLNFSWCGHYDRISIAVFTSFIENCGQWLTSLRLANCQFVTNPVLKAIANVCVCLKELDLSSCRSTRLNDNGFCEIARLKSLRKLNMYRSMIHEYSIQVIIESCENLEYLNLSSCFRIREFDRLMNKMGQNCRKLKSLELWRAKELSAVGVTAIARQCFSLEELDIGWCYEVNSNSGCFSELARNCPNLKRLVFTAIRSLTDSDLLMISSCCLQLEQLDIVGTRNVSFDGVFSILGECKKLRLLDLSFCSQLSSEAVETLRDFFPKVTIKKSFQINDNP